MKSRKLYDSFSETITMPNHETQFIMLFKFKWYKNMIYSVICDYHIVFSLTYVGKNANISIWQGIVGTKW